MLEYEPVLGRMVTQSWRAAWEQNFPRFCPDTESSEIVGIIPDYEVSATPRDPRCRFQKPGAWQFLPMRTYPSVDSAADFDQRAKPIIGTDYPGDDSGPTAAKPISRGSARNLLKYGCIRQALLGNTAVARQMFDMALAQWDGEGFIDQRNSQGQGRAGTYFTRDLAFAMVCANAAGEGGQSTFGTQHPVSKAAIEQKLWAAQSPSGGIWTNYCGASATVRCTAGVPPVAKQTNEIAPLVLLAYGPDIWRPDR